MCKFKIVACSTRGPLVLDFNGLDEMAQFLMGAYREFSWKVETASAWKKQRNTWVPCWPYQMKVGA